MMGNITMDACAMNVSRKFTSDTEKENIPKASIPHLKSTSILHEPTTSVLA